MNYYNISGCNNQVFSQQYIKLVYWMNGSLPGYLIPSYLSIPYKFTDCRRSILNTLIKYFGIYNEVYISQDRIAQLSGVHHDTVLRTIKIFVELGILKKKYRGANKTCVYTLTSFLHHPSVKWALKDILPNLYWAIESAVSRCKTMLSGLTKGIFMNYSRVTARLSNDNNKRLNTIKKPLKYIYVKPEKEVKMYIPDPDHDRYFNEFLEILKNNHKP